jgi:hypothetical protein
MLLERVRRACASVSERGADRDMTASPPPGAGIWAKPWDRET